MNESDDQDRLPASVGGLLGFAAAGYLAHAPLYLALATLAFAIDGIAQFLAPDKDAIGIGASVVGDALLIGAVSLGVATRATGKPAQPARLFEAAVVRWGDVTGASGVAAILTIALFKYVLNRNGDDVLSLLSGVCAWILVGALSFAGPVTALSNDRPIVAIVTGFGRSLALSLRLANLPRLVLVTLVIMIVTNIQVALALALNRAHAPHAYFWSGAPLDALTVGPLAALQAAFALDFARRVRRLTAPPR